MKSLMKRNQSEAQETKQHSGQVYCYHFQKIFVYELIVSLRRLSALSLPAMHFVV